MTKSESIKRLRLVGIGTQADVAEGANLPLVSVINLDRERKIPTRMTYGRLPFYMTNRAVEAIKHIGAVSHIDLN